MIPIDPIAALEGLQSAISMVKKASKVANDLGGLAPMIGKMFDAKSAATKALIEAKKGKGSNMGTALQIEMALEQQNQQLLVQMNQRAKHQLHLQETVEGLSVVAISYYGSQLVHYLSIGAMVAGVGVVPEYATALSIPLIALSVWVALRIMRRRLG